jgi:tetratricopeptide (TPR) repeat protein
MTRRTRKPPSPSKLLLPALLLSLSLAPLFGQSGPALDLYQKGLILWEAKDYDKAAASFEQAVQADPFFAKPYLSLGVYFDSQKADYAKAASAYMSYIGLNGEKKDEARKWLKVIAYLKYPKDRIPPREAKSHRQALVSYNAAVKDIGAKRYDAALLKLNDTLAVLPYYIDALYARGLIYNEQDLFFQALKDLESVWYEDPDYRDISYYLAVLYDIFATKSPRALGLYRKYLATPGIPADRKAIVENLIGQIERIQALQQRALQAFQKNDLAGVEKIYQDVLAIRPDDILSLNNLGIIFLKSGQPKKAEEYLVRAKNVNPYDPSPYYNLACLYAVQKDPAKALLYYKAGLNYMPQKMKRQALADDDLLLIREDLKSLSHE